MAVRFFCDHCGLEVLRRPSFYCFGCFPDEDDYGCATDDDGNNDETASYHNNRILLCKHCGPIWMKQVGAITSQSEPSKGKKRA